MGDVAIRVDGLGKRYTLGGPRERYGTLRDQIGRAGASLRGLLRRRQRADARPPFWALKDVSFEVKRGEAVGIIGRNGAGKSTLLKILSRITEPTEGGADLYGRVGSLLEVGTGFHPELTGRENIYLNGAILGMRRAEIVRQFDAIVAFAEVEKFVDTPVKHYSSGMYTRLAFAVAAHLEPDILIVDEVLAVGDAEFQKKCLGKMEEVAGRGRTVLFVSHNMTAVLKLCARAVILKDGRKVFDGTPAEAIPVHLSHADRILPEWRDDESRPTNPDGLVRLTGARVRQPNGLIGGLMPADKPFDIEIEYIVLNQTSCQIAFRLNRADGETVLTTGDGDVRSVTYRPRLPGRFTSRVRFPGHFLRPGRYYLLIAVNRPAAPPHDLLEAVVHFEIDGVGSLRELDGRLGVVLPQFHWSEDCVGDCPEPLTLNPQRGGL